MTRRIREFIDRAVAAQSAVDAIIASVRTTRDARNDLLITSEVARVCRVSERTVRHWVAIGRLRTFRVGRRHLLRRGDVVAMLRGESGKP
jgi:excisionase family DNA binding protein